MPFETVIDRAQPAPPVPQTSRAASLRILVADDQREVIEAVRLLVSSHDLHVAPAASPDEAVELAASEAFDAALIDLNYQQGQTDGEQGLQLVSDLLDESPSLPIVVMTAWGSSELAREAMRRGARDVVEKPWDESRLVSLLRAEAELGRALQRIQTLEDEVHRLRSPASAGAADVEIPQLQTMRLLEVEGQLVRHAMERHHGNVSRAARTLGLSRSALYRRLERHRLI